MKNLFGNIIRLVSFTALRNMYVKAKAKSGDAEAQGEMARKYYHGWDGFPENHSLAFEWARRAADSGGVEGMYILGCCYMYGHGVAQDKEKGARWHHESAERGHEASMFSLGHYYKAIDRDKSVFWFKRDIDACVSQDKAKFAIDELRKLNADSD